MERCVPSLSSLLLLALDLLIPHALQRLAHARRLEPCRAEAADVGLACVDDGLIGAEHAERGLDRRMALPAPRRIGVERGAVICNMRARVDRV